MKRSERDRLLRGILDDENLERVRRDSLVRGLAAMRSRRWRRTALTSASASLVLLISVFALTHREPMIEPRTEETKSTNVGVKFINDAELLALFPDRPLALFGPPGEQRLVFLDAPATSSVAAKNR